MCEFDGKKIMKNKAKTKLIPDYQVIKDILSPPDNLTEGELISLWLEVMDYDLPYEGKGNFVFPLRVLGVLFKSF